MKDLYGLGIILVIGWIFFCLFGFDDFGFKDDINKYKDMIDATVIIYDDFGGGGSGVFIDDNIILTAAHCLESVKTVTIELSNNITLRSNDFYIDDEEDIGFIFVDANELCIAKISPLHVNIGDIVYLVGTPHNKMFKFTLTKGILSHLDRNIPNFDWKNLLQTDAEGGYGSSGGPLYNCEGKVIGIYVGHAYSGGVGVSLCESAKSILDAYERCKLERIE